MWKPLLRSAIFGGLVVFLWHMFSWMVLPWYDMVTSRFNDQEVVAQTLLENISAEGIYVLPSIKPPPAKYRNKMDRSMSSIWNGPFVFANVRREGIAPNEKARQLLIGLLTNMVGAGLITWLLLQTKKWAYWSGVKFVTLTGFIVSMLSMIPLWNWWGFSLDYTLVSMIDMTLGWLCGGFVIAHLARVKSPSRVW